MQPPSNRIWTWFSGTPRARQPLMQVANTAGPRDPSPMPTWSSEGRPPTTRPIALGQPRAWAWSPAEWVPAMDLDTRSTMGYRMRHSATLAIRAVWAALDRTPSAGVPTGRTMTNWTWSESNRRGTITESRDIPEIQSLTTHTHYKPQANYGNLSIFCLWSFLVSWEWTLSIHTLAHYETHKELSVTIV